MKEKPRQPDEEQEAISRAYDAIHLEKQPKEKDGKVWLDRPGQEPQLKETGSRESSTELVDYLRKNLPGSSPRSTGSSKRPQTSSE